MIGIPEYIDINVFTQILSLSIGIIGLILGILFYLKGKKNKKPIFSIRSYNLINELSGKIPQLEVLYSGNKISNLTISKIAFWNDGNATITKQDIAPADPIKILTDDKIEIFDAEILEKIDANNFELINLDNKSKIISFDFLAHNEGAIFKVIHSGKSSKDISIVGTIIGSNRPKEFNSRFILKFTYINKKILISMYFITILIFLFIIIIENYFTIQLFFIFLLILFVCITIYILKLKELPKQFTLFDEET